MPNYDFKCDKCGDTLEANMPFDKAERGLLCAKCEGTLKRQFTKRINITGCNRFIRKKGLDAKQDRYYAMKSLEEKGKLPKAIKPERGIVNEL